MIRYLAATALVLSLAGSAAAQAPAAGTAIERQQQGQVLADTLIGTNVYNSQNESVGEVNDLLVAQDGRIAGVIIGVGGFLGIGERNVALPWNQVQMQMSPVATATTSTTTGANTGPTGAVVAPNAGTGAAVTPNATGTAGTTTTGAAGTTTTMGTASTGTSTGTAGSTATGTGAAGSAAATATGSNNMRLVINMSREDVRNLPEFRTLDQRDAPAATGNRATGTPGAPGAPGATPRP